MHTWDPPQVMGQVPLSVYAAAAHHSPCIRYLHHLYTKGLTLAGKRHMKWILLKPAILFREIICTWTCFVVVHVINIWAGLTARDASFNLGNLAVDRVFSHALYM